MAKLVLKPAKSLTLGLAKAADNQSLVLKLLPVLKGEPGVGISGGAEGDLLVKQSAEPNDAEWKPKSELFKTLDGQPIHGTGDLRLWYSYAMCWSVKPEKLVSQQAGVKLYRYTKGSEVVYRTIPTPYNPVNDAFYRSLNSSGVPIDLIVAKG